MADNGTMSAFAVLGLSPSAIFARMNRRTISGVIAASGASPNSGSRWFRHLPSYVLYVLLATSPPVATS
jgi:hypothetical protein